MPKHTAVIYFHGIGDHQRHSSLSNFLDYFDRFGEKSDKVVEGKPRSFQYKSKLVDEDEVLGFSEIKKIRVNSDRSTRVEKVLRIFECYWAPESTNHYGIMYFVWWVIARIKIPVVFLFSPWRRSFGLRLVFLHSIINSPRDKKYGQSLEKQYREFENWKGRAAYPSGTFSEFVQHLRSHPNAKDLIALAYRWRRAAVASCLYVLLAYFALGVFLVLTAMNVIYAVVILQVSGFAAGGDMKIWLAYVVLLLLSAVVLSVATSFKKNLFDVFLWTMDSEKDQRFASRRRVLDYARKLIRNVTSDPECRDCVIVAHSLGSAIALEALLQEGLRAKITNRLHGDLSKVRFVFTVGSPIDRIFYFFQSDRTFSHRYSRLYEEQRLSVALPPFTQPGPGRMTNIVNFWSRYDPISSSLTSLSKSISERRDAVTNVEVLTPGFPFPGKTHSSYFADPRVMAPIYKAIMKGSLEADPNAPLETPPKFWMDAVGFAFIVVVTMVLTLAAMQSETPLPWMVALGITWFLGWALLSRRRSLVLSRYQARFGVFLQR